MPFVATWMDVVKQGKDKYHMIPFNVESKIWHKWTSTKQKQTHRHREQTCGCQGGEIEGERGRGGMDWDIEVSRCKLSYIEGINNILLYNTVNYIQCVCLVLRCVWLFDCSLAVYSVHGIFQARILVRVAISYFRGSSWPRDQIHISCIGRQILYHYCHLETQLYSISCDKS